MNWKSERNVVSYRVREFDSERYVVESYTAEFQDELLSYAESEPKLDGHIQYHSDLKRKERFREHIHKKCAENVYDYEDGIYREDIEAFNFFLATHYFPRGSRGGRMDGIGELNAAALRYMEAYNASLRNLQDAGVEEALSAARSFLRGGIDYIECMNVGQANFSIGRSGADDRPLACFDIGIRTSKRQGTNPSYPVNQLKALDGNGIVVISHYDYDHISGYQYISGAARKRIWILPERRPSPSSAERRLLNQLVPQNCIFRRNVDYAVTPFDPAKHILSIGNIEIYQGNARKLDSCQSTQENARCLICLVKKGKSILLPADCLYKEFPTSFQADYMAVPHHCCFYDEPIKNIDTVRLEELIVFAGPNDMYKHPNTTHLDRLISSSLRSVKVICLMNHNNYCFQARVKKNAPLHPRACLNKPSYKVYL